MRFAVDAHAIGRHLTGNEVYVRSLLNAFGPPAAGCEVLAYISADEARGALPANVAPRRISPNPYLRLGYEFSRRLRADRPDLLHVQYTAPLACPVPVVVSVHDVSFLEHPEYFPAARALQLKWTVGRTVRQAAKIVTCSEFSRWSILKVYGDVAESKVVAIHNAAAPEFRPISREAAASFVRREFNLAAPYILSVGDLQPRKNHIGLIRAFASLVRHHPQITHHLVLAGQETWFAPKVREAARQSGVPDRIHFLGYITDTQLLNVYNASDLFAFPTFYEGFGLPVLEAMACGRAVVTSNTTSLPEVADGAALLCDPYALDEIVRAMADLLLDPELRARQERLGLQRAAHFSWQKAAQRTMEVYHEVAEVKRRAVGVPSLVRS